MVARGGDGGRLHGRRRRRGAWESVSDEICLAIRNYFSSCAVVADREVQLFGRRVSRADGGKPGSEVDVLVSVPKSGVKTDSPIVMPIEVKRSCNDEAKTAMKTQLVDRYMEEAGTAIGVYILAWFDAHGMASHHRPKWSSIDEAKSDLELQAKHLRETQDFDVRVGIVDLTLR